jgi:hypothetical protein
MRRCKDEEQATDGAKFLAARGRIQMNYYFLYLYERSMSRPLASSLAECYIVPRICYLDRATLLTGLVVPVSSY